MLLLLVFSIPWKNIFENWEDNRKIEKLWNRFLWFLSWSAWVGWLHEEVKGGVGHLTEDKFSLKWESLLHCSPETKTCWCFWVVHAHVQKYLHNQKIFIDMWRWVKDGITVYSGLGAILIWKDNKRNTKFYYEFNNSYMLFYFF